MLIIIPFLIASTPLIVDDCKAEDPKQRMHVSYEPTIEFIFARRVQSEFD